MIKNNYVLEYYDAIKSGEAVVSRRVRQLYERLSYEIEHPESTKYVFDLKRANAPIQFIETFCRNSKGPQGGKLIRLELFQKAFIAALYGFINPDTGLRRYREAFLLMARKNGKSTLAASLALYHLLGDFEIGPEVYCVSNKLEQSNIIFDTALSMVKMSPDLRKLTRKRRDFLECEGNLGKIQPLTRNSDTLDGLNSSFVIQDEIHALKDRNLYEVLKQSMSARKQPLYLTITTCGTLREGVFDELYNYSEKILDGEITDDTFLPVLYELDQKSEWTEESAWYKANPGLGTIKNIEDLRIKVNKCKQDSSDLTGVLCKDMNVRETDQRAWLSYEDIVNEETFSLEQFRGSYFVGGVDLSSVNDLTCATALMFDPESEKKYVYQCYFLPEATLQDHIRSDSVPYDAWLRRGLLRVCEGNRVNYHDVTEWFYDLVKENGINPYKIYYDPWSSGYWAEEMRSLGFVLTECRQGFKTLSTPMKLLEADLKAKKVVYNSNPILQWCLGNTDVKTDVNDNIMPVKLRNRNHRIDGTASLLNAYVGLYENYEELKDIC